MSLQHPKTQAEYQRAVKVMPYGVNSNFRYWGPQDTMVVSRGQGAYLWDADGTRYIDYRMEIELAERLTRMTGMDQVRLANSGTEATIHALRLARAHTGRERFIKFEGQYHGMSDYFLYSTASSPRGGLGAPTSPVNAQVSSGIPKWIAEYVINLPYNRPE